MFRIRLQMKNVWKIIYDVIEYYYFYESKVKFPKYFLMKYRAEYNIPKFVPHCVKKNIQQVGLE